ncbi:MAG: hypothetical protein ACREJX_13300 [Polyangiaceae bacterium]
MKLCLRKLAIGSALALCVVACGQAADEATSSNVQEIDTDGFTDEDFDGVDLDGLGPDPEPMISDEAIDAIADEPDLDEEAAADDLVNAPDQYDDEVDDDTTIEVATAAGATTAPAKKKPVRCKKRIHATFAIYTYLAEDLNSNGCWTADRTKQDTDFRECHSNGEIKDPKGKDFFYDDTNPSNAFSLEKLRVDRCAKGEKRGFEYMAFREGLWRLVRAPHVAAYFAELYTDDTRIDDLYYDRGVFRGNKTLAKHSRVAPMLNIAPYPPKYATSTIEKEIVKVCSHVKNHGFIGFYEWHFPLSHDSKYLKTVERALNRCTRK